jgi:hypothetical protein
MTEVAQPSLIQLIVHALGPKYLVLLPLAAIIGNVLIVMAIVRWRGAASVALLMLAVPMPIITGFVGFYDGMISSMQVIAMSTTQPKPSELAEGQSTAMYSMLVGLWLSVPGFITAVIGSIVHWARGTESNA